MWLGLEKLFSGHVFFSPQAHPVEDILCWLFCGGQKYLSRNGNDETHVCGKLIGKNFASLPSTFKARVQEAKTSMAKRLEQARLQNEQQLQTERDITSSIMHAIRELPPLQAAMELGDLRLLEEELRKRTMDSGDCKGVVGGGCETGGRRGVALGRIASS